MILPNPVPKAYSDAQTFLDALVLSTQIDTWTGHSDGWFRKRRLRKQALAPVGNIGRFEVYLSEEVNRWKDLGCPSKPLLKEETVVEARPYVEQLVVSSEVAQILGVHRDTIHKRVKQRLAQGNDFPVPIGVLRTPDGLENVWVWRRYDIQVWQERKEAS